MGAIYLADDFKEFLRLLNSTGVEFMVVGGYAVAYHGHPRATGDLDLWVANDDRNIDALLAALKAFGFELPEVTHALFAAADRIVRMGVPPVRIELLTGVSGLRFREAFQRSESVELDGVPVRMLTLDDLRTNKRAAARPKDLADLDALDRPADRDAAQ
ncbi:MAG: nucleotidyltransferase [Phycisphaerales bacterium]